MCWLGRFILEFDLKEGVQLQNIAVLMMRAPKKVLKKSALKGGYRAFFLHLFQNWPFLKPLFVCTNFQVPKFIFEFRFDDDCAEKYDDDADNDDD